MAHIRDRWYTEDLETGEKVKTARHGDGRRWQLIYTDSSGKARYPTYDRKGDAETKRKEVEAALLQGLYVDPSAAKTKFRQYVDETWWPAQVQHAPNTAARTERSLRIHIYPTFGDSQLGRIRRTAIQKWVNSLAETHAPTTVRDIYTTFAGVMSAAHADDLIPRNPCTNINLPVVTKTRVTPLPVLAVEALIDAVPDYWRLAVILAAGTGMRLGEILGLTLDRIEFLHRRVRIDRQAQTPPSKGRPHLRPTKTPSSDRLIPTGSVVLDALSAHVKAYPPKLVEVDEFTERAKGAKSKRVQVRPLWVGPKTGGLVRAGTFRQTWDRSVKQAEAALRVRAAEARKNRDTDLAHQCEAAADRLGAGIDVHECRHFFASLLIAKGANVKVVQARLGHTSATVTLDTYGHLWPDSEDDTRTAVDAVLGGVGAARTVQGRSSEAS